MCGRFVQYSAPVIYATHFKATLKRTAATVGPSYNLAPGSRCLAVFPGHIIAPITWGRYHKFGSREEYRYINARAETVDVLPTFTDGFEYHRCIVPAEGFYEWERGPRGKIPFLVRLKNHGVFGMAGIYARHDNRFWMSIITCDANQVVKPIHGRMPVVLEKTQFDHWLDGDVSKRELKSYLHTPIDRPWTTSQVDRRVNDPSFNQASLVA